MSLFNNRGTLVTTAATGINLALGVLYTWSIFKGAIKESIEKGGAGSFNWELASLNDPYAVCCLIFAFTMILAGKLQDHFGPRLIACIGGVLVGLGFIIISQTTAYWGWIIGFGILVGMGIAFGYSSATPAALKWYPHNKTGRISGIVVSGFGLASVYIAPLAIYLLANWGMQQSMLFFGIGFMVIVCLLAMLLITPPADYKPEGEIDRRDDSNKNVNQRTIFVERNVAPLQMIKTPTFWLIWTLYLIGAGAGLMVIGNVAGMAKLSLGESAFIAVAMLAIGNASGRIVAGIMSDKIGQKKTLAAMFFFQAVLMFSAIPIVSDASSSAIILVLLTSFIGFNYGSNLSLFPAWTKDLWGIKNFGVNYGLMFTAWGVGGFIMSRISQSFMSETGNFNISFIIAGVLLVGGGMLSFVIKSPKEEIRQDIKQNDMKDMSDSELSMPVKIV